MQSVLSIGEMVSTEDWELARQVISSSPEFYEEKEFVETEFGISLDDLDSVIDLPIDSFKDLKKALLEKIQNKLAALELELYQKLCVELDYCHAKTERSWRVVGYIAGALDMFVTNGGAALAMLVVKMEYLDKLCGCKTAESD